MNVRMLIPLAIVSLLLVSCKSPTGDEGIEKFRLNITVEPLEAGTVSPLQGEYDKGESVQLSATPHEHWVFRQWTGDHTGTTQTVTITMDKDKTITALFNAREYPLNISIEGQGSVGERVVQQKDDGYEAGTLVELTAVADEGWQFQEWQGDLTGTETPVTITISGETTVKAIFARKNYTLSVSVEGEGTVTEEVIPAKTTDYPYQTTVKLTAIPAEGWDFSHWSGAVTGTVNPVQLAIEGDVEVVAVFVKRSFTVTITYEGPGSTFIDLISGNRSGDNYEYGSLISIRVQPYDDWEFVRWEGDLTGTDNPIEVTVTGDITAKAVMKQTLFDGEGTVSNPYKVATLDQLQAVRGFIDKHFLQVADIDASATEYWNEGRGFQPIAFMGIGSFTGSYDGGGFTIYGLKIDLSGGIYVENTSAGLFGRIKNAQIRNLNLADVKIISEQNIVGTGGLAGWATSGSSIQNVHVNGQISGTDNIGGLIGIAEEVFINAATTDVTVSGGNGVGGLIGTSGAAWIYNAHAYGSVTGAQSVGGFIGNRQIGEMI
ncbi:MAG: ZmpA/ZmpB/ZmpC family metallo-endopeptidase-related protein, partial [Balneolaceae bacterium]|nr:ZmpA/ZmpB/ZmpC family metallo-endopeptidase-related protein [Balneolaceae bacterium]